MAKNDFKFHTERKVNKVPEFPEDIIDYTRNRGFNRDNLLIVFTIFLMFGSIFLGAYGEQESWNPIVYVPIAFVAFLLSIYFLMRCLK